MQAKEGAKGITTRTLVKIPGALIASYTTLLALEYGIVGAQKILKYFGLSKSEANAAIKSKKISPESAQKISVKLPPASKEVLANANTMKNAEKVIREKIKEDNSFFENALFEQLTAEGQIQCKRNEFSVLKNKKYDDNTVVIVRKKYYGFVDGSEVLSEIKDINNIK